MPERRVYVVPGNRYTVVSDNEGVEVWGDQSGFFLRLAWGEVHPLIDTLAQAMLNDSRSFQRKLQAPRSAPARFTNPPVEVGRVRLSGNVDETLAGRLRGDIDHSLSVCVTAMRDAALGNLNWETVERLCKDWDVPLKAAEMRYVNGLQRRLEEGTLEPQEAQQLLDGLDKAKGSAHEG